VKDRYELIDEIWQIIIESGVDVEKAVKLLLCDYETQKLEMIIRSLKLGLELK